MLPLCAGAEGSYTASLTQIFIFEKKTIENLSYILFPDAICSSCVAPIGGGRGLHHCVPHTVLIFFSVLQVLVDLIRQGSPIPSFRSVWTVAISYLPQHEVMSELEFTPCRMVCLCLHLFVCVVNELRELIGSGGSIHCVLTTIKAKGDSISAFGGVAKL